jgi:hypothetical protein
MTRRGDGRHLSELASVDLRSQGEFEDSLSAHHPTGRSASSASVLSRSIISRRLKSAASFTWPAPPGKELPRAVPLVMGHVQNRLPPEDDRLGGEDCDVGWIVEGPGHFVGP